MPIKAMVAASVEDKQGDYLTPESLEKLTKERIYPVLENFDSNKVIGRVENLEYEQGKLFAQISLYQNYELKEKVFSFAGKIKSSHKDEEVMMIDDFDLMNVSLISKDKDVYPEGIREEIIYVD